MFTIAIVDDHPVFREGLRSLLDVQPDLSVIAEWSDAREAQLGADQLKPDLFLVDVKLADIDGISLTRELLRVDKRRRVLVVSMYDDPEQAVAAGAAGYAIKSASAETLLSAVRTVARGESYFSPSFDGTHGSHRRARGIGGLASLSAREREIFLLVVRGMSGRDIAKSLFISPKTVESHRYKINRKLGVRSVAELIRFAVTNGVPIQ